MNNKRIRIAILGGGPAGLFMYKRLIESGHQDLEISIFERNIQLGAGMPYSSDGANDEHITNVSDKEIPELPMSVENWVKIAPQEILDRFGITTNNFNEFKVLPRIFFGHYLSAQFQLLQDQAKQNDIATHVYFRSNVIDVIDKPEEKKVIVVLSGSCMEFDRVVICTGHYWPLVHEGKVPGCYDSPYPPSKLELRLNHPVAIRGSSLTAIDAIKTLSRSNGEFIKQQDGRVIFQLSEGSSGFKLAMHSIEGLLPAIRFHLEDTRLSGKSLITPGEFTKHKLQNDGFLSLDYVFEKNFKRSFLEKDPAFYKRIKNFNLEEFVGFMMDRREHADAIRLFRAEYAEAEKSIRKRQPIYWKEMLADLSFAMNYQAKYLSAEDMLRLTNILMPLVSIVIAFVPQSSARELLALYDAGVLEVIPVNPDSAVVTHKEGGITYNYKDENNISRSTYYQTFVDCIGQPHLLYEQFPFKSMLKDKTISPARISFRSAAKGEAALFNGNPDVVRDSKGNYYLRVPGITINDNFQVVDDTGISNERIFILAVPYIGGYNPDYSGLDFCEEASGKVLNCIFNNLS